MKGAVQRILIQHGLNPDRKVHICLEYWTLESKTLQNETPGSPLKEITQHQTQKTQDTSTFKKIGILEPSDTKNRPPAKHSK